VLGGRLTSSDVHLYYDLATINPDRLIPLTDSEGLSGGNQTPFGSLIDDAAKYAMYYSNPACWKPAAQWVPGTRVGGDGRISSSHTGAHLKSRCKTGDWTTAANQVQVKQRSTEYICCTY
jgi:hypothetical protein